MEGLLPFLCHAIKKRRSKHKYRCFSESSYKCSYHLLLSGQEPMSLEGSSCRHKRYKFQPPATAELFEQQSALEFDHSCSCKEEIGVSAVVPFVPSCSKMGFSPCKTSNVDIGKKPAGQGF
ncbi:hypothetical protein M0R45_007603 [Rubus argutus]|uniref:Uncharacterized protein n=1 Tax=Rubus argutus TaxID=59490 RepID=A0AAW1XY63_RUBAR